jgi:hypothetical protein
MNTVREPLDRSLALQLFMYGTGMPGIGAPGLWHTSTAMSELPSALLAQISRPLAYTWCGIQVSGMASTASLMRH